MADCARFDYGDMSWVVPKKLLIMSSPSMNPSEGFPPCNYMDFFRKNDISALVRLNEKLYVDEDFFRYGLRVYPMEMEDGKAPS